MPRTILSDVAYEMATDRYKDWAAKHVMDAGKVAMELAGEGPRPTAGSPYARLIIEAIRVGLAQANPPAPAPELPPLTELAQNVLFTAQDPLAALHAPSKWRVALTADPGPEGKWDAAVRDAAPKLKATGHLVAVWGNQAQTGAARIWTLARDLGADFVIFQAETVGEYTSAIAAGAQIIVGNPNSWTQAQRDDATARCSRGELVVMFEVYANVDGNFPNVASSRGVPVVTEVLGIGGWDNRPDVQLDAYATRTPAGVWSTMSVYLAEAMSPESWSLLP